MGISRFRHLLAALLGATVIAAIAAGCGGGDGSGDEKAAQKKLENAGAKLSDAKAFEVSLLIEIEEEGQSEEAGCVALGIDSRKGESIDMRVFDKSCSDGPAGKQVIVIGNRAWVSSEPGSYTAATIPSEVVKELDDEQTTDLQGLFEAAEGIEIDPDGGSVLETEADSVTVPRYSFHAPASAFPDSEDLGDTDVQFEATIDRKGFLREVTLHGEQEDTGVTVTEKYDDIEANFEIGPPAKSEISGPTKRIHSREELEALIGA